MKTKLLVLLVALAATLPASAAKPLDLTPRYSVIIDRSPPPVVVRWVSCWRWLWLLK